MRTIVLAFLIAVFPCAASQESSSPTASAPTISKVAAEASCRNLGFPSVAGPLKTVRVHSGLPFQVATSFSTCDFLPVFLPSRDIRSSRESSRERPVQVANLARLTALRRQPSIVRKDNNLDHIEHLLYNPYICITGRNRRYMLWGSPCILQMRFAHNS